MIGFEFEAPSWVKSLDNELSKKLENASKWIRDKTYSLGSDGFNTNIVSVGNALSKLFSYDEAFKVLRTCGDYYEREVSDHELHRALGKVFNGDYRGENKQKWPKRNQRLIASITKNQPISEETFQREFDGCDATTHEILEQLFGLNSLVSMSPDDHWLADTKPLKGWQNQGEFPELIVSSPMSKPMGMNKEGKPSKRCNDNTGKRKFLVIEQDETPLNEQLAIIKHLSEFAPLAMVVYSGSKSYHAWFQCHPEVPEEDIHLFMVYAVSLGADKATYTPCQLVRTPNATRSSNGKKQKVISFRPELADVEPWQIEKLPSQAARGDQRFTHISDIEFSNEANDFIEGLLNKGEVSAIVAPSGVGKSFFALDIGSCVAMGRNWRGREVEQGGVLYVCLEGDGGFKRRIKAFQNEGLLSEDCPFYLDTHSLSLLNEDDHAQFISAVMALVEKHDEIMLIMIDTFARATAGAEENSSQYMTQAMQAAKTIADSIEAHVCLIHHTGKNADRGARGSSSFYASLDTEITLSKHEKDASIIVAQTTKQKDFPFPEEFQFSLKPVDLGSDTRDRPLSSCVVEHRENKERPKAGAKLKFAIDDLLKCLPADSKMDWKLKAEQAVGISSSSMDNYLNKHLKEGVHYEVQQDRSIILTPTITQDLENSGTL